MIKIYLASLFLILSSHVYSQGIPASAIKRQLPTICGTSGRFADVLQVKGKWQTPTTESTTGGYAINLYFHIVRNTAGTGGQSTSVISTIMSNLQTAFCGGSILFVNQGHDEIHNDTFTSSSFVNDPSNSGAEATYNSLVATQVVSNSINIYLLDDNAAFLGGQAKAIPSTALAIGGTYPIPGGTGQAIVPSLVLAHELGHCLGLYHTFESFFGNELVNETNCSTAGDKVCDTPAESYMYNFNEDATCTWLVSFQDANFQTYSPDPHNIMCYVRPSCYQYFTTGQFSRINSVVAGGNLNSVLFTPPLPTVSSLVCTTGTATIGGFVPQGASFSWSSANPSGLTVNSTSGALTKVGSFNGTVGVNANYTGCGVTVQSSANTFVGAPIFTSVTVDGTAVSYSADCSSVVQSFTTGGHNYAAPATVAANTTGTDTFSKWAFTGTVSAIVVNDYTYNFSVATSTAKFSIQATATNACGSKSVCTYFANSGANPYVIRRPFNVAVYPNPTNNAFKIERKLDPDSEDFVNFDDQSFPVDEFSTILYNNLGQQVRTAGSLNGKVEHDVSGLPEGLYFLDIITDDHVEKRKVLITR